jgi:hypothetical protein
MRTGSVIAVGFAALALALPGVAGAQGSGDQQYQDPFANESGQGQGTKTATTPRHPADGGASGSSSSGSSGGSGSQTSTGSDAPTLTQTAPTTKPATPSDAPQRELPRTGQRTGLVALCGMGLVLLGMGLRELQAGA